MNWTRQLLVWYDENYRSFPWRATKDPYRVWLSEIILQQTRTEQGLPYYLKFIKTFPTITSLAEAEEDVVLKLWQGLGYYSRARNLHYTAKYISNVFKGVFPRTFSGLMELKGVGDYTASAIGSICFDLPEPVVDGNVYRFLSRYFGIETPIDYSAAHKIFKAKAQSLMNVDDPGRFNQAMMEFGALQCIPKNPQCDRCPFQASCSAFIQNRVKEFPFKLKKIKIKKRYFNYFVVRTKTGKTIMEQRQEKGIWQKLYQFPLLETSNKTPTVRQIEVSPLLEGLLEGHSYSIVQWNSDPILHKLSHQHLEITFWIIKTDFITPKALNFKQIQSLPVPVVIEKFIEKYFTNKT